MTMASRLPTWLDQALDEAPEREASHVHSTDLAGLAPGDVWIVRAADREEVLRRHVLILDADPCGGSIRVALMSNSIDFATDDDLVLDEGKTSIPYQLMVQTRILGQIRWSQAIERVGLIDDDLLDQILDFIWDERPTELDVFRGLPCPDRSAEPRLGFERGELSDLRRLEIQPCGKDGEPSLTHLVDANILDDLKCGLLDLSGLENWKSVTTGQAHFCHLVFATPGCVLEVRDPMEQRFGQLAMGASGWLAQSLSMDLLSGATVDEPITAYGDNELQAIVCRSEVFDRALGEISLSASRVDELRLPPGPVCSLPDRELVIWRACSE
jgi:hypothetical protein